MIAVLLQHTDHSANNDPRRTYAVAVFAKAPVLGDCKTRLQPLLGEAGALAAHCHLVESTLERLIERPVAQRFEPDISLWLSATHTKASQWSEEFGLALAYQKGRDLGAKMAHALDQLLRRGVAAACVIGTDCPTLDRSYLERCFALLDDADVVLGPAEDGGYGLVGVRGEVPDIFSGIDWGTAVVTQQTLAAAQRLNRKVALADTLWDVDWPADWARYQALLDADRGKSMEPMNQ